MLGAFRLLIVAVIVVCSSPADVQLPLPDVQLNAIKGNSFWILSIRSDYLMGWLGHLGLHTPRTPAQLPRSIRAHDCAQVIRAENKKRGKKKSYRCICHSHHVSHTLPSLPPTLFPRTHACKMTFLCEKSTHMPTSNESSVYTRSAKNWVDGSKW